MAGVLLWVFFGGTCRDRYALTPSVNSTLSLLLTGSYYATVAAVWVDTNGTIEGLLPASRPCYGQIGCTRTTLSVVAGTTYAIQVDVPSSPYNDNTPQGAGLPTAADPVLNACSSQVYGAPPLAAALAEGAGDASEALASEGTASEGIAEEAVSDKAARTLLYNLGDVYLTLILAAPPGGDRGITG